MGSRPDRPVRADRPPGRWGHGPGIPGPVHRGAAVRGQDDQDRPGRGARVPRPLRAGGRRRAPGQRRVHRGRGRGRPRGRDALAGHRLRPGPLAEPAGAGLRPAAGADRAVARRRVRGGAGIHSPGRPGAPRPQAVQRAGRAGRPPGDRLRRGPRRRAHPAHGDPRCGRHPRLHGAGAGPGLPARLTGQRRVFARRHLALRRDRPWPLSRRDGHGRAGQAGHRAARHGRAAARPDHPDHGLPGTQPAHAAHLGGPAGRARLVRRGLRRPGRRPFLPARFGDGPDRGVPAQPAACHDAAARARAGQRGPDLGVAHGPARPRSPRRPATGTRRGGGGPPRPSRAARSARRPASR